MLQLCAKPGFGVIIQAGSVLQFPFLGQLSIDIHDHGCVCVPHPGLQSLDLDAGFIACRAEGDTEIMTADQTEKMVCFSSRPVIVHCTFLYQREDLLIGLGNIHFTLKVSSTLFLHRSEPAGEKTETVPMIIR